MDAFFSCFCLVWLLGMLGAFLFPEVRFNVCGCSSFSPAEIRYVLPAAGISIFLPINSLSYDDKDL